MKKYNPKVEIDKMKTKTWFVCFFKCMLNLRAYVLQSELNKVSISNFVKFRLKSLGFKIEREFEKKKKMFHQNCGKNGVYKDHK